MAPLISVITPALPSALDHLDQAGDSVEALRRCIPGEVEWVLCLDGPAEQRIVGPDVVIEMAATGGVSSARNVALAHASGRIVVPLDADDLLEPEGVNTLARRLEDDPELGWVAGNRTYVDGSPTRHWITQSTMWRPGSLAEVWTSPFVFHPNCVLVKRSLALHVGGWPAVRTNEDLAFVFAISRVAPGSAHTEIMVRYRSWRGQTTAQSMYLPDKSLAFAYIAAVENEWRRSRDLAEISAPVASAP